MPSRYMNINPYNSSFRECSDCGTCLRGQGARRGAVSYLVGGASPEPYRHHTMRGNALDLDVLALGLGQRRRVVLAAKTNTNAQQEITTGVKTRVRTIRELA